VDPSEQGPARGAEQRIELVDRSTIELHDGPLGWIGGRFRSLLDQQGVPGSEGTAGRMICISVAPAGRHRSSSSSQ
jgi:hypothetical protein